MGKRFNGRKMSHCKPSRQKTFVKKEVRYSTPKKVKKK